MTPQRKKNKLSRMSVKTPSIPPAPILSQAAAYADRAISMMRTLGVLPMPKNFAIFFAHASGQPVELFKDIEALKGRRERFSDEVLDKLYSKYIAEEQTRIMQDSATNARKIVAEIMESVSSFKGVTTSATADMVRDLKMLDEQSGEEVLRLLAKSLIESATAMQNSSVHMTEKLEGAQQEIALLKEDLARVVTEAERDFLTGIFNRKAFDRRMHDALQLATEKNLPLTLLMIDIDHFKRFNDSFGHLIGDEVLKIVARTLTDTLKGMDCVARFGGEEFAVLLPATPLAGGMVVAENIRKSIASRELKRKTTGENFGAIHISVGVATLRAGNDNVESLVKRADDALYRSKNEGRNRVTAEAS